MAIFGVGNKGLPNSLATVPTSANGSQLLRLRHCMLSLLTTQHGGLPSSRCRTTLKDTSHALMLGYAAESRSQGICMLSRDIERFIADYVKELEAGTAAIFAGAGLSISAGFVDWVKLLGPVAEGLDLNAEREQDHLVALAQYHVNKRENRSELHKRLLEEFPSDREPSINHQILSRLPVEVYWTTNYDHLIEKALDSAGKIPDVKHRTSQLALTKPRRDAVVYKMHGDVDDPAEAVLTKDDYERYASTRGPFITALSGDLVSRTFLFLGFSFKDPNLDYVLARLRLHMEKNGRQHYCVMREVKREEFNSDDDFNYSRVKQELAARDLLRYNIVTLFADEYVDITEMLRRIESAYKRKTIFISGSAEAFGDWEERDVLEFLTDLGRILVDRGYQIVSGFGLGVSNALLTGAIEKIYNERKGHFDDFLTVRPFPRYIADADERRRIWTAYRKDLIQRAGVAIFLFGNKSAGDAIVPADGVYQEYEIAKEFGLDIVPVGATGYVAQDLGTRELETPKSNDPAYLEAMKQLQVPTDRPQELASRIIEMLNQLNGGK